MEKEKTIITTIDGVGSVEAKNDRVCFTVSLKSKSESLERAESQVKEKTDAFLKSLEHFKMNVDGEVSTSVSNYKLEHRENNETTPAGFQSVNTVSWTMVVDDNMDKVYAACMKTDPTMPYPIFSIKDRVSLQDQAYEKAAADVKAKLNKECALLGIAPEKLKVHNWNFGHEGYLPSNKNFAANAYTNNMMYGAQGATGATGPSGSTGILSSRASLQLTSKLGSIYQELLNYKLVSGITVVMVPVQVNYVWVE